MKEAEELCRVEPTTPAVFFYGAAILAAASAHVDNTALRELYAAQAVGHLRTALEGRLF